MSEVNSTWVFRDHEGAEPTGLGMGLTCGRELRLTMEDGDRFIKAFHEFMGFPKDLLPPELREKPKRGRSIHLTPEEDDG